jgi:hypothetical protein
MYRYTKEKHNSEQDFEIPTGKKLNSNNRWIILAKLIPGFLCLILGKQLNLPNYDKLNLYLSQNKIRLRNKTKYYNLCARQAC